MGGADAVQEEQKKWVIYGSMNVKDKVTNDLYGYKCFLESHKSCMDSWLSCR